MRVSVYINGSGPGAPGRRVLLDRSETLDEAVSRITSKLSLTNRCPEPILFTTQGIRVADVDEIIEGEVLLFEPRGMAFEPVQKRDGSFGSVPSIKPSLHTGNTFEYEYLFKFILVGSVAVGKSCILLRFTDNRFRPTHETTIGVDFGTETIQVRGNHNIKIQIWDTAGQESYKAITRAYFREAAAALIVYDVTNPTSFTDITQWLENVKGSSTNRSITIALIANKSDKEQPERRISSSQGESFALDNGLLYFETSALSGSGIQDVFLKTAEAVLRKLDTGLIDPDEPTHGVRRGEMIPKLPTALSIHPEDVSECGC